MSNAHFLQIVNHAPLYACLFGILLLLYGLVRKDISLIKAGLTTVLVGSALAVYLLSAQAEFSPNLLVNQAQWQQWGLWVMVGTGMTSLLGLLTTSSRPARARKPKVWAVVTLFLSLGSLGILVQANMATAMQPQPEAQSSQQAPASVTVK